MKFLASFCEIDVNGTNYINATNLKAFLMKQAYLPNDNLLLAIIRRVDLDCDAQLNFNEFVEIIRPQAPPLQSLKKPRA